ncbi:MAG TPA: substrate-binding domain-containing protein, partial [Casimicrobiaceae bacterium]|nr:substrate-binding domain-containing protein [Casimicrobiaceae bacterium]
MKSRWMARLLATGFACAFAQALPAAEVKALFTEALRPIVEEAMPRFEAATGHTVVRSYGTVGPLVKRVQDGERADLFAGPHAGLDTLGKESRLVEGSLVPIAVSRLGVAQRAGAIKPDVASPEALKRTLLLAKSVTYVPPELGGAS